jgi:hypothetical protein
LALLARGLLTITTRAVATTAIAFTTDFILLEFYILRNG